MKVIHIVPTAHIAEMGTPGTMHLPLAQVVLRDRAYARHYRSITTLVPRTYVILDNGAFEAGAALSADELMLAADMIRPHEIVLPDVLRDPTATVARSVTFVNELRRYLPGVRKMAVPQGSTFPVWEKCLRDLVSYIPDLDVIGVFEETEKWFPDGRLGVLRSILPFVRERGLTVHLLGYCEDLQDLWMVPRQYPWVRSMDSGKVCVWSMHHKEIYPGRHAPQYPGRPKDYFDLTMTEEQFRTFRLNVARIDRYLEDPYDVRD